MSGAPPAVVFDIGSVLVEVDVQRAVRRLSVSAGTTATRVEAALFGTHHRRLSRGELSPEGFHREVAAALGTTLPFQTFTAGWCDMFTPIAGMEAMLARLSRRHPTYLCSNTDPLHYRHLQATAPALAHARGAVLSFEVGAEKPEPAMYRALLDRFSLDAAATIFVDDRADNVAGAERMGITGVLFEGVDALRGALARLGVGEP